MVSDDLDGCLVGTNSTVGTKSPELTLYCTFSGSINFCMLWQRSISHIIFDSDGESVLHFAIAKVFIYCKNLSWCNVLGTKSISSTYDYRSYISFVECVSDILVKWLSSRTWFFCSVKNSDLLYSLWNRVQEVLCGEWSVKMHIYKTNLFTLLGEVVYNFFSSVANRSHSNDYMLSIWSAMIVEQSVVSSCDFVDFFHVSFNNFRNCKIISVSSFSTLEIDIRVLCGTSCHWSF